MTAIPRISEFNSNMLSSDYRVAGAAIWAYGDTHQTYPAPNWVGWDTWSGWGGDIIDYEYYYDAGRNFHEMADYTGDSQWSAIASKAVVNAYLPYIEQTDTTRYAYSPPQAAFPAHHMFPVGVYLEWQRTTDPTAKARVLKALFALANNAGGFGTSFPIVSDSGDPNYQNPTYDWLPDLWYAREVGYNLRTKYLALSAGYNATYGSDPWGLTDATLVGLAYRFADQAIGLLQGGDGGVLNTDHRYVRPFMMANLADGLVAHFDATADTRVVPKLVTLLGLLWDVCYRANGVTMSDTLPDGITAAPSPGFTYGYKSLSYTDRIGTGIDNATLGSDAIDPTQWVDRGGGNWDVPKTSSLWPVPELNGLIMPYYYWLFKQTGNTIWRDRADLLFDGLVGSCNINSQYGSDVGAQYNNYGKVFNQVYERSYEAIRWRTEGEAALVPMPTIDTGHPLAANLDRCYNFDKTNGSLVDIVTGDPLTLVGTPEPTIEDLAPYGKSVLFNGSSAYSIPSIDTVNKPSTYTIYAIFKTGSSASTATIVSTGQSGNWAGTRIKRVGSAANFYHNDGGDKVVQVDPSYANSTAYHAAMTYDGTNMTAYIDGVSIGSVAAGVISVPFGDKMTIGSDGFFGDSFYYGNVWAVYIWYNRALTPTEIASLYADPTAFIAMTGGAGIGRGRRLLLRRRRKFRYV